jgi:phosphate acetyltransferase
VSEGAGADFAGRLAERAAARPRTLVFPEGREPRIHHAVARAVEAGLFEAVLLGEPSAVARGLEEVGLSPDRVRIVDPTSPDRLERFAERLRVRPGRTARTAAEALALATDPLQQGALMVDAGEVHGSVAGAIHTTASVVRAALRGVGTAPGVEMVSSSFYMAFGADHPAGPRVLTFTDAAIVPEPSAEQLAGFAVAASRARSSVVGDEPRVAFLSYSTKGSADGASVERVRAAVTRFRELMPDVPADGELQGDAALVAEIGARKAPGSRVAGRANVLVFPDLDSGNIAYKLVQHLGGARAFGPILHGLAAPCSDLSRGAVPEDIVAVACITSLMAA